MMWGWQFIFYSRILVQSLVTSMKELINSYVILQVECQKYQIIFEIKMQVQFSKFQWGNRFW